MSRLLRKAAVLMGAAAVAATALPAAASSLVTLSARQVDPSTLSLSTSASYVAAWNALLASQPTPAAGYANQTVTDWNGSVSNYISGGGANTDLGYHDQVTFTVAPGQTGLWDFRFGVDFGFGGTLIVDGTALETLNNDMWWGGSYSNPTQFLAGSADLSAGTHTIDIYGFEGCCDGGSEGQYQAPGAGAGFHDFTTVVPEPAAWALMILGFGGVGAVLRRRRTAGDLVAAC
ncbi:CCXG family PEP-CTERM protein [Phenylobacterium sp.]|uniref:CCXG family PEP-CTERM protein n=1 Tax=Phenylobacterium sp. TaxID=1871053 RepID=UPI00122194ED|nr:CCXG family PEP-CTERM protein [Phenylobacterium sp.]THD60722.1 MAG: PEP-CTERM sorting domain-containing protein [Phenylobacterium sp.]